MSDPVWKGISPDDTPDPQLDADQAIAYIESAVQNERFAFISSLEEGDRLLDKNPSLQLLMWWNPDDQLVYILPEFEQMILMKGPVD